MGGSKNKIRQDLLLGEKKDYSECQSLRMARVKHTRNGEDVNCR